MVEVAHDTDDTNEFKCAILDAGRPGAVKCSTQCRHCEVTYPEVIKSAPNDSKLEKPITLPDRKPNWVLYRDKNGKVMTKKKWAIFADLMCIIGGIWFLLHDWSDLQKLRKWKDDYEKINDSNTDDTDDTEAEIVTEKETETLFET